MTYTLLEKVIRSKNYDYQDILKKMDVFLTFRRITNEQYEILRRLLDEN